MTPPTQPPSKTIPGFTLIEVTLALAITSIALIALLAMVPQGLMTMKLATDRAIEARIHQQIHSEVSLTDWNERSEYHEEIRYYDEQGIQLEDTDKDIAIYTARILVPQRGDTFPQRIAGGSAYDPLDFSGSNADENEVQLILVEVSSAPNIKTEADFDNSDNWRNINTYQSTLTRLIDLESLNAASP